MQLLSRKQGAHILPRIHINDGMAYYEEISDEMLSVINSSVLFAADNSVAVSEPPTLSIIALALFGFIARKTRFLSVK